MRLLRRMLGWFIPQEPPHAEMPEARLVSDEEKQAMEHQERRLRRENELMRARLRQLGEDVRLDEGAYRRRREDD